MIHARDVEGPLQIGQIYLVDRVFAQHWWWPIFDEHMGDISGKMHFHVDGRFLTQKDIRYLRSRTGSLITVRSIIGGNSEWIERRDTTQMKCLRNFGKVNFDNLDQWKELQDKLIAQKCKLNLNCMTCPHQGLNLKQVLPVNRNGGKSVICPNHHMEWSLKDGSLIERKT